LGEIIEKPPAKPGGVFYILNYLKIRNRLQAYLPLSLAEDALPCHGKPKIFKSGQGSQFNRQPFVNLIQGHGIQVNMDGKGRWVDNVAVESL
jgi:putative transposase